MAAEDVDKGPISGQAKVEEAEETATEGAEVRTGEARTRELASPGEEAEEPQPIQGTRWPGMPTCPHLSPVCATGNSENPHISV